MLKNLLQNLFLHSIKRTFLVTGGLVVMLSIPLTIALTQQQQDIRQRAAGEIIKVTNDDYIDKNSIAGKEGYEAVFDPSQGGWVYVPTTSIDSAPSSPTDESTQISYQTTGNTQPTFRQSCTIITSSYDDKGNIVLYNSVSKPPQDNCQYPYRCEPRTGYGNICVEPPQAASVPVGGYCRQDYECQTMVCYYAPGYVGVSSCINPLPENQSCHKNNECQSGYCWKYAPYSDLGLCKTQCSPSNCEGTCNTQTNECSTPTITNTPTPPSTNTYPLGPKPDGSICEFNYECQSNNCSLAPDNTKRCLEMLPPPQNLTCDPNNDGKIDIFDFNIWRDEYLTKISNTTKSACFAEDKTKVDIFDFNVWRDLYILKKIDAF